MATLQWSDRCGGTCAKVASSLYKLEGKYSLESTDPRESEIRAHLRP